LASYIEPFALAKRTPSAPLRELIINRIDELKFEDFEAAEQFSFSPGQMSRLKIGDNTFTLDRLINAAANIGISVHMTATRPYRQR